MAVSESTGKAGDTPALIAKVAALQNLKEYAELNWTGSFEDYLALIRKNPAVTRSAFQRVYDMILSYGQEEYIDNKKRLIRYNFFKDEQHGGRDAIFGLDIPLMRLVSVLQSAAQRYGTERRVILLHGPVGSSKSTIARLIKRGMEEYSRTPEGALYTYDWVLPEKLTHITGGRDDLQVPDARGAAAPHPARVAREGARSSWASTRPGKPPVHIEGDLDPACRLIFRELMAEYKGDWARGGQAHPRPAPDPLGAGPRRHRDVPAEGREEPGLDRADRRHQLPEDRRVRVGQRSARVQLRRRVQHRQPRRHRVHRGAQAGRGVPLRPAGRVAGAQDQAEEVRADRHRRGDPRPHQRGRVQEAALERVHGGAARPDGEDRHPVHHARLRGAADLRQGLQRREDPREAHRAAHAGDGGHVGGADAARGSRRSIS